MAGKLNDPQRAQRYADRWVTLPDMTQQDAVRAGFRAGLRAARGDLVPLINTYREELGARFVFMVQVGLWDDFQAKRHEIATHLTKPSSKKE